MTNPEAKPEAQTSPACHVACHAIVPAAGHGMRYGADMPKQYLPLMGRPLIWYSLAALCAHPGLASVWVVLSPEDACWDKKEWQDLWLRLGAKLEIVFCGGETRAQSVRNALAAAAPAIAPEDWVLVHDAARPCLSHTALDRLLTETGDDPVGGLLAMPLADTLKRDDDKTPPRIAETRERAGLWQAQTPQMFRYAPLADALTRFPDVTDEAGAIEAAGFSPRLVRSDASNLKVTYPGDLVLAEWILRGRRDGEN